MLLNADVLASIIPGCHDVKKLDIQIDTFRYDAGIAAVLVLAATMVITVRNPANGSVSGSVPIDDAATVRMYHRKILGDAGWQTDEAVNGVEALERVVAQPRDEPYDLYVVDINMPKMDGYSFVRELRRLGHVPQAPVMMVSTESQTHDATAAQEAGANCYLIKPAKPHELVLTAALLLGDGQAASRAAAQAVQGERP
mgnify:CR=1 FL=1